MLYLDTSFIAPLVLNEDVSAQVEAFVTRQPAGTLAVSHWTRVEFASLVAREVRMQHFSRQTAAMVISEFETLVEQSCVIWLPTGADYDQAQKFVARFDTGLRGGDGLHLAIAVNNGAEKLLTLDDGLLKAANMVKFPASRGIR